MHSIIITLTDEAARAIDAINIVGIIEPTTVTIANPDYPLESIRNFVGPYTGAQEGSIRFSKVGHR